MKGELDYKISNCAKNYDLHVNIYISYAVLIYF